jgi:excisionase family DNA binding protein
LSCNNQSDIAKKGIDHMARRKNSSKPSLEALLTIEQTAEWLGLSKPTVYELIYNEGLPTVKLGKSRRIILESLQQWVKERERPA